MEILIEEDQVLPVGVTGISRVSSVAWPVARSIWDKQRVHSVVGREGGEVDHTGQWNPLRVLTTPCGIQIPYSLHQ